MAPSRSKPSAAPKEKAKAIKIPHPHSRKAGQLERASLRKGKLGLASTKRSHKQMEKADRYLFFYHLLPDNVPAMSLPQLHKIVSDIWLRRHDEDLRVEQDARRPGRPRSAKEDKLLETQLQEREEYRSGLELPDLTDERTVELFRRWKNGDPQYLTLLRLIRLSSEHPEVAAITRRGQPEAYASVAHVMLPPEAMEMDQHA